MNFTSQKSTFQTYTNGTNGIDGTSPHIGEEANGEKAGYWYIGLTNTGVKAEGADALTILLSNDNDIIVRNNLGAIVGGLPTTQVLVLKGANQIENAVITETPPPNFEKGSNKHYTFVNGLLTINQIPDGFEGGTFTFTYGAISKSFSLKVVSSEVDYNLIIEKTLINTTTTGGTVSITAKKVSSEGTTIIDKNESNEIMLYINNYPVDNNASWSVSYQQGDATPISIILKISTDGGENWIEWDKETIEFVANGDDSVAYWLQCSTPIISKAANGEYQTSSVTFTPMIQVGNGEPRQATDDDNIKVAIWKDQNETPTSGDRSGTQTIDLVPKKNENIAENKYSVENALHCRMFFIKNGIHVQVDEQTAEVLADGVTISNVEYTTSDSGVTEPTSGWSINYPNNIQQGMFLWTKITYSNGKTALSSVYEPLDGTSATAAYTIDLTNENIFIGTDRNGNRTDWSLLDEISEVTVTVWEGGENITSLCDFSWEVSNGSTELLSNYNTRTVYFKSKEDKTMDPIGADSITAEVTVTKRANGSEEAKALGAKTCSVTKNKQGEPGSNAITYSLAVSPNSWNLDDYPSISPTFIVTKYTGNTPSTMTTGYTIQIGDTQYDRNGITQTTTFDLWIGGKKVDSETVTAVQNGHDSIVPGPTGKTAGTITLYMASGTIDNNKPKAPNTPTVTTPNIEGILDGWSITVLEPSESLPFVWKTMGTYSEDADGKNRTYGTSWTTPELHSAYYGGISGSTAAEYYKLFGTDVNNNGMKFNDQGKLYINASMINTGTLTIKDTEGENGKTLFSAGWIEEEKDGQKQKKGQVFINGITVGEIASKQDVDNIEIGGRNLIADTDNTTVYSGNKGDNEYKDVWVGKTIVAPTDTQYIISFDAKAEVEQNIKCFFYSPNTTLTSESSTGQFRENIIDGNAEVSITTEWKRYWVKWTQNPANTTKNIIVGRNDTANNIYIRAVKLEKGNKATAWTPAPEDIDKKIVGRNLAKDSQNGKLLASGSKYERLQYQLSETLNNNAEYLISVWIENSDEEKILATTLTNGDTSNTQIYSLQNITCKNGYGFAKVSKNYNGKKDISAATHLEVYKGESGSTDSAIKILKVKLEKGNTGTDWCPADADVMQASVNNAFSWNFSPTKGMFMWNGAQGEITENNPTGGAVLAVYNDNGTHKLSMKGRVEAEEGSIGGWEITPNYLAKYAEGDAFANDGIFREGDALICPSGADVDLTIAGNTGNNWVLGVGNNFGITTTGTIYADSLVAKKQGYLGPYQFAPDALYSEDNSLRFSQNGITLTGTDSFLELGSTRISIGTNNNGATTTTFNVPDVLILRAGTVKKDESGYISIVDTSSITLANDPAKEICIYYKVYYKAVSAIKTKVKFSPTRFEMTDLLTGETTQINSFILSYPATHTLYWSRYLPEAADTNNVWVNDSFIVPIPAGVENTISSLTFETEINPRINVLFANYLGVGESPEDAKSNAGQGGSVSLSGSYPTDYTQCFYTDRTRTLSISTSSKILIKGNLVPEENLRGNLGLSNSATGTENFAWATASIDKIYCRECLTNQSFSDIRLKNSIEDLDYRYEKLFDQLQSVRYKYNEGTSNRYHTGFIAQSVIQALENAELTTQDFAAVALDHMGTENERWYLRRDEFVALNTWQIQKLKPRVSSLEQTILEYKTRISNLENQLKNLTS